MTTAANGDKVRVRYTGRLGNGKVFDATKDDDFIEFVLDRKTMIPGFEDAVVGMAPGEKKVVLIAHDQAYGPVELDLVMDVPRDQLYLDAEPCPGQTVRLQMYTGKYVPALVTVVSATHVTLNANHPLAGKDLEFEIELIEIVRAGG